MDRSHLVLDIETILDPELPLVDTGAAATERLPPPPHHQIVCIGVLWFDRDFNVSRIGIIGEGKTEAGALWDFARFVEDKQPTLVTYNGRAFDLPVLATRCLRHGVPFRHYYQSRDLRYRFSAEGHLDLMDYVADYGAARNARLDVMAKLCGMPGKLGVDGKDVGPLVHEGRLDEVRNYCLCDVVQTAGVFLRLQLVRGELTVQRYQDAMGSLIEAVRNNPRVQQVSHSWNEARLRLTEA